MSYKAEILRLRLRMTDSKTEGNLLSDPIRILHFADLHIGMENYGRMDPDTGLNGRVQDFLDRLDTVVTYAQEHDADLVLFAGDAFRTRSPSTTHQREFAHRIRQLSDAGIPVVLLVGNHDVPVMSQRASSIEIFGTLGGAARDGGGRPVGASDRDQARGRAGADDPLSCAAALLSREQFRRMTQDELDTAISEVMIGMVESLAGTLGQHSSGDPDGALLGGRRDVGIRAQHHGGT